MHANANVKAAQHANVEGAMECSLKTVHLHSDGMNHTIHTEGRNRGVQTEGARNENESLCDFHARSSRAGDFFW